MTRIRVGLIGLSTTSSSTNWAARAHLPYLQSPQGQEKFEIVALCNSSVSSAQKSIEHYKLPSSVKAYDSAAGLANDPDVDLVVNVTGVERHYELLMPVVQAGKNVFTELPLAENIENMRELRQLANEKKIKTIFGMQGQTSPVTTLLRSIIATGKIGKVLSSTWIGFAIYLGEKPDLLMMEPFTRRKVGANIMTVGFLHTFNHVLATLGELDTFHSILGNQRPRVELMDPKQGGKVLETVQKDTPDQVLLQGRLESGALLSYHLRGGNPFSGQPGVTWMIYGEKGEIRITSPVSVVDITNDGVSIKLHEFEQGEARDLELPNDAMGDLSHPCQNVGRIYEAYAEGREEGEGSYPNWDVAMKRHELIEEMWRRSDSAQPFGEQVMKH